MRRILLGVMALVICGLGAVAALRLNPANPTQPPPINPAAASLSVGFASRDITPEVGPGKPPVYMAGFGHNRLAQGVNDPLSARAVVLSDGASKIALVSIDVVGFFYENALHVRQGLPGYAHVVVSSTHNHEGPDTLGLWGATPVQSGIDKTYLKRVETEAIAAVKAADAALKPARAKFGSARAPDLLADSREPYILHDELYALRFDPLDPHPTLPPGGGGKGGGKPLGILVNWHCHPETLADKNTKISADFVGFCVEAIQKKYDCPVAYFTGTVGGMMTTLGVKVRDEQGTELPDRSMAKTMEYGKQLARVAEKALAASTPTELTPIHIQKKEIYLPLANPLYKIGRAIGVLERDAYRWEGNAIKAGEKLTPRAVDGEVCIATEVSLLTLGEVQVACIPGEIYPEIVIGGVPDPADPGADFPGAPIEPAVLLSLPAKHKMLFGLANDEIGYIIPKRQWDEKPPFCYNRKKKQYGEENSCGPETAPIICTTLKILTKMK